MTGWRDPGKTNNPVGPEPKLTAEVQEIICNALAVGSYLSEALLLASIDARTFRRWMARGAVEVARRERAAHEATYDVKNAKARAPSSKRAKQIESSSSKMAAREQLFVDFRRAVEHSLAKAETSMLQVITRAAVGGAVIETSTITRERDNGDRETVVVEKRARPEWTAAAWRLERRYPAKWGRRLELIAPPELPVDSDESTRGVPIDSLRERIKQLRNVDLDTDSDDE